MRADFLRREYARFNAVAQAFQVASHLSQPLGHVPSHVLKEAPSRPAFSDEPDIFGPQVPRVELTEPLAGEGEWLAWVAASKNINAPGKGSGVEAPTIYFANTPLMPYYGKGLRSVQIGAQGSRPASIFATRFAQA